MPVSSLPTRTRNTFGRSSESRSPAPVPVFSIRIAGGGP
jgi:hypothetical protein